ncbi:MAG TPA: trypsin-like serine protease [Polyangiaceae bacterium]|nr:trypsin-like serine protease [Polyangiaceae bacterium]
MQILKTMLLSSGLSIMACGASDASFDQAEMDSRDSPIIGGAVDTGDPSVVAIFSHPRNSYYGSLCTGSVIAPRVVLTAAHCLDPRVAGSGNVVDVYRGTSLNSATRLAVSSVAFDPAFDPDNLDRGHDVGVVILSQATTLKPLPFNRDPNTAPKQGSTVRIVGYGSSTHADSGAGTKRSVSTTVGGVSSSFLLIGGSNQQTCHGDSGGPAFQNINGVETLVGLTSFGMDRSQTNVCFGGGYDTRVEQVLGFIDKYLQ